MTKPSRREKASAEHVRGYVACLDRFWPYVEQLERELKEARADVLALTETVEFLGGPVDEAAAPEDVEGCLRVVAAEAAGFERGYAEGLEERAESADALKRELTLVRSNLVTARRWFFSVVALNLLAAAYAAAERWM